MKSTLSKNRYKKDPTPSTGKYAHLVRPIKSNLLMERGSISSALSQACATHYDEMKKRGEIPGPGYADHLAWMFGKELDNLDMNFNWGYFSRPGIWKRGIGASVSASPEVTVFAGLEPKDIDYLGASIEIEIGEEKERYIIDRPSAVIKPAGIPFYPAVTRWVDRPFAAYTVGLSGKPEIKVVG
jgi:hypothetical protein